MLKNLKVGVPPRIGFGIAIGLDHSYIGTIEEV